MELCCPDSTIKLEIVGEGAQGPVYSFVSKDGMSYVLKPNNDKSEAQILEYISKNIKDHSHVIRQYSWFEHKPTVLASVPDSRSIFSVLEKAQGTLNSLFGSGTLTDDMLFDAISQVCDGAMSLVDIGVYHTDLHTSNVLYTKEGEKITYKIADFADAAFNRRGSYLTEDGRQFGEINMVRFLLFDILYRSNTRPIPEGVINFIYNYAMCRFNTLMELKNGIRDYLDGNLNPTGIDDVRAHLKIYCYLSPEDRKREHDDSNSVNFRTDYMCRQMNRGKKLKDDQLIDRLLDIKTLPEGEYKSVASEPAMLASYWGISTHRHMVDLNLIRAVKDSIRQWKMVLEGEAKSVQVKYNNAMHLAMIPASTDGIAVLLSFFGGRTFGPMADFGRLFLIYCLALFSLGKIIAELSRRGDESIAAPLSRYFIRSVNNISTDEVEGDADIDMIFALVPLADINLNYINKCYGTMMNGTDLDAIKKYQTIDTRGLIKWTTLISFLLRDLAGVK